MTSMVRCVLYREGLEGFIWCWRAMSQAQFLRRPLDPPAVVIDTLWVGAGREERNAPPLLEEEKET